MLFQKNRLSKSVRPESLYAKPNPFDFSFPVALRIYLVRWRITDVTAFAQNLWIKSQISQNYLTNMKSFKSRELLLNGHRKTSTRQQVCLKLIKHLGILKSSHGLWGRSQCLSMIWDWSRSGVIYHAKMQFQQLRQLPMWFDDNDEAVA